MNSASAKADRVGRATPRAAKASQPSATTALRGSLIPTWRHSEDDGALILYVDGADAAEVHRWTDDKTGETAWWTATARGVECGIFSTLREAARGACDKLDVPFVLPPRDLLAEHGEEHAPPGAPDPAPVIAPAPANCESCRWWSNRFSSASQFKPVEGWGECRRYAPRGPVELARQAEGGSVTAVINAFAMTAGDDWCGEHIASAGEQPKAEDAQRLSPQGADATAEAKPEPGRPISASLTERRGAR